MKINQIHFNEIDSTNSWAKRNAEKLTKDKITVIYADEQLAGRGRHKNKWVSPKGNLYASFCFFVDKPKFVTNVAQLMGLVLIESIEKLGLTPMLKWPNDILLANKKCAGILTEIVQTDDRYLVVVGVGVNLKIAPKEFVATSLFEQSGQVYDIVTYLDSIERLFSEKLTKFLESGFEPFLNEYRQRMAYCLGKKIQFHDAVTSYNGVLDSIQNDGSLNLILENGQIKNFSAGCLIPATS